MSEPLTREELIAMAVCGNCDGCVVHDRCDMHAEDGVEVIDVQQLAGQLLDVMKERDDAVYAAAFSENSEVDAHHALQTMCASEYCPRPQRDNERMEAERDDCRELLREMVTASDSVLKSHQAGCLWDFTKDFGCDACYFESLCDARKNALAKLDTDTGEGLCPGKESE